MPAVQVSSAAAHAASPVSVTGGKSPASGDSIARHSVIRSETTSTQAERWFTSAQMEWTSCGCFAAAVAAVTPLSTSRSGGPCQQSPS